MEGETKELGETDTEVVGSMKSQSSQVPRKANQATWLAEHCLENNNAFNLWIRSSFKKIAIEPIELKVLNAYDRSNIFSCPSFAQTKEKVFLTIQNNCYLPMVDL